MIFLEFQITIWLILMSYFFFNVFCKHGLLVLISFDIEKKTKHKRMKILYFWIPWYIMKIFDTCETMTLLCKILCELLLYCI